MPYLQFIVELKTNLSAFYKSSVNAEPKLTYDYKLSVAISKIQWQGLLKSEYQKSAPSILPCTEGSNLHDFD